MTSGRPNLPSGRPVRGSGTPDPRPRTLIFASGRPKSVVPIQISPLGERILTSGEVKTRSIWPILGSEGPQKANFRDPSLEKVAEFWPRRGSVLHFWTPKDPQILKVHKMRPKFHSNVGLKTKFSQSQGKNPFLVAFFLSIQELWLLHNEKRRTRSPRLIQISQ